MPEEVNLLDLASAAVASTVTAAKSIQQLSQATPEADTTDGKNTRLKPDGTVVTDADFVAQGVICKAIQGVSGDVRFLGEESEEEMAQHIVEDSNPEDTSNLLQLTGQEVRLRYHNKDAQTTLPLTTRRRSEEQPEPDFFSGLLEELPDPPDCFVDPARVSIVIDPLDGSKSYADGDYDAVSILIAIVLDNTPIFGVVGKPFGYKQLSPILDSDCVTFYGGTMLKGVYVAGGGKITHHQQRDDRTTELPRPVSSLSKVKGIVNDFLIHLGEKGLVQPDPLLVSGAGEKSLRLILRRENEALWFFPKGGTSLWDVAAPDALLRAQGGKMTDKFGHELDYSKTRKEAENVHGVVACTDEFLHSECVRLFQEGGWNERL